MSGDVLMKADLPGLRPFSSGKVRDIFDLGDRLLIVTTDRISAYDVVLPNGIPGKGRVLTQMSIFWFRFLGDVANHFLSDRREDMPPPVAERWMQYEGRTMIVRKAKPFPVECVVRGYLAGSGWKEYRASRSVCGVPLPDGLRESDRLPEPIFTPATKAQTGHDENISFDRMAQIVGRETAERLRALSLEIYKRAAAHAESRGIILADTKFEFGTDGDGRILLIDEVLTPDSSRFWPKDGYAPGRSQPSFDKQFVRDYLDSTGWNHTPPAPLLPDDIVMRTAAKYREALERLTG
jgi:phosphoribosylaminoimidazole-succinocarboxamide synthase